MKATLIIVGAVLLVGLGLIDKQRDNATAKQAAAIVAVNEPAPIQSATGYGTASGHTCTREQWQRQFQFGVKPGEEACHVAGVTRQPPPVEKPTELQVNCEYLRWKLDDKKIADLTPRDLRRMKACSLAGY